MSNIKQKFNKNLKYIEPYYISILPKIIKRMHSNEAQSTILNYDIIMKNVAESLNFYPENKSIELIEKAHRFYNIATNKIISTNGSDEAIDLCIRTFCNQNDKVLVIEPTFSMYKQYAIAFGVEVKSFNLIEKENYFIFDEDKLIQFAKINDIKIIFIPNPLANIGTLIQKDKLIKIIKSLPNTIIVIDEAYIEFVDFKNSLISELNKYKNLVILRTFSKFFGLAGIRLGFIFTHFKNDIMKIKSPYNVNSMTCQIGINVLENITQRVIKNRQEEILYKRIELEKWIRTFNEVIKIFKSDTNFLFIKLSCASLIFAHKLEKECNIKIKTMSGKFENYCRISVI